MRLIHGFTGTTSSMKPMAEDLAGRGLTVLGPRLPGHGTDVKDMGRYSYNDWIAAAETALAELQGICDPVFVSGLSMGGLLTLYLGEQHSDTLAGVMPISAPAHWLTSGVQAALLPIVPALKRVLKTFPGPGGDLKDPDTTEVAYERFSTASMHELIRLVKYVDGSLGRLTAPIRIFHAREDHVVPPENAPYIYQHVGSMDKDVIWLDNSYHVATLDLDRDRLFEECYGFIRGIAG